MSIPSDGVPPIDSLFERYKLIRERIRRASEKSGRAPDAVVLLGVTKTVEVKRINETLALGLLNVGENRIQEAMEKRPHMAKTATTHLIGPLQSNKVRKAVELFDVIQSLDREKIAGMIDRIAAETGKVQRCLVEVKISNEPTKSGVPLSDAGAFIESLSVYKHLKLEGIMTIGELGLNETQTRAAFGSVAQFFQSQKKHFGEQPILSMGMSDDFEMAIAEGSTMVRIGRALFGDRS